MIGKVQDPKRLLFRFLVQELRAEFSFLELSLGRDLLLWWELLTILAQYVSLVSTFFTLIYYGWSVKYRASLTKKSAILILNLACTITLYISNCTMLKRLSLIVSLIKSSRNRSAKLGLLFHSFKREKFIDSVVQNFTMSGKV